MYCRAVVCVEGDNIKRGGDLPFELRFVGVSKALE